MQDLPNIFLIGPMGAGKSTIGRLLAAELSRTFHDSDHAIQDRCGADIPWIFDVEGEPGFRQRETQMIDELTAAAGELGADPAVRAVILAAEGKSFCAGGDLGWMREQIAADDPARASADRSTTKSQPWLKPALGARVAASRHARRSWSATGASV